MTRTTGSWVATRSRWRPASPTGWRSSAGQRALDVGCGPGALTAPLVDAARRRPRARDRPVGALRRGVPRRASPASTSGRAPRSRCPATTTRFDVAAACLVVHFMTDPVGGRGRDEAGDPRRRLGRRDGVGPRRLPRADGAAVGGLRRGAPAAARRARTSRAARATSLVSILEGAGLRDVEVERAGGHRHPPDASRSGGSPTCTASARPGRPSPRSTRTRRAAARGGACAATSATGRSTSPRWRTPRRGRAWR